MLLFRSGKYFTQRRKNAKKKITFPLCVISFLASRPRAAEALAEAQALAKAGSLR